MAKDDYFVIAYRILDYLYQCFEQGNMPDVNAIFPSELGTNDKTWIDTIQELRDKGYIILYGEIYKDFLGKYIDFGGMKITLKGIKFVLDNRTQVPKKFEEPKSDIVYLDFDEMKVLRKMYRKLGCEKDFPEEVTRGCAGEAGCPTCHAEIGWIENTSPIHETKAVKYCPYCGQRISWGR